MFAVPFLFLCSVPAQADLVAVPSTISAAAGGSGSFDIQFTNTGSTAVSIGAFSIGIDTSSTDVTLLGATSNFFGADSFDTVNSFPFLATLGPPLLASDLANDGIGPSVAAAATVNLGTITFQVSGGAPTEKVDILFSPAFANSVVDNSGADITGVLTGAEIQITGSSEVPEPASLAFLVFIITFFLFGFRCRRLWRPGKITSLAGTRS